METKTPFQCCRCDCGINKGDAQFIDEESFGFLSAPPQGLALGSYCPQCFESRVRPELENYQQKLELAKNVNVFFLSQSKESRFVRRTEKPVKIENCQDRDEAVLRLAFLAVEAGKNSLVDVDLSSAKVRNGGWQSSIWSGRGIPAQIDEASLQRRFPGTPN